MKVILPGYEGTKKILTANSYFINKFFPGFDVFFLNYGSFDGKLFCGQFYSLDSVQRGGERSWAKYLLKYLHTLKDEEYVILADGDFFITKPYDQEQYALLLEDMKTNFVGFMSMGDDPKRFSRTAQYAIWNLKFLIMVLSSFSISSIWKFESRGGNLINHLHKYKNIIAWRPVLQFDPRSSISFHRAPGKVAVGKATREDVEFLIANGYLNREELVIEHSRHGHPVINYK